MHWLPLLSGFCFTLFPNMKVMTFDRVLGLMCPASTLQRKRRLNLMLTGAWSISFASACPAVSLSEYLTSLLFGWPFKVLKFMCGWCSFSLVGCWFQPKEPKQGEGCSLTVWFYDCGYNGPFWIWLHFGISYICWSLFAVQVQLRCTSISRIVQSYVLKVRSPIACKA